MAVDIEADPSWLNFRFLGGLRGLGCRGQDWGFRSIIVFGGHRFQAHRDSGTQQFGSPFAGVIGALPVLFVVGGLHSCQGRYHSPRNLRILGG